MIKKTKNAKRNPLASPFSEAKWVWADSFQWDLANSYALFRKSFELGKIPASAPLFLTADQSYRLYVNGKFVCRGPARGWQASWPYDEIDVRAYLKPGRNVLAIRAYNPGRSNFQYLTQGFAGLLVAAQWGAVEIATDATWKCARQDSVSRGTAPSSIQLFNQEHIDLQKETGDWRAPDFDDSAWRAPVTRPWNSGPWFGLETRGIPMMAERTMKPQALIGIGNGTSGAGYELTRDVAWLRYNEDRSHRPTRAGFTPLMVTATGKGKFRSYLFDFGKTVVGNLTLDVDGAGGGEIIDTLFVETIDMATQTPDMVMPTHCRMAFGDRVICRAGKFSHDFYHHNGFRYLTVTVRDAMASFQLAVKLNWTGYPLEPKGSFTSSDGDLERIWEACAWTQQCCSLDAYVDTPWREQTQWWGDARVQAANTFHLNGDTRLFRRGMGQIAKQVTPDGVTYGHAPTIAHDCVLPDFTLIWMLTLWDYYWQTGSVDPLLEHHDTVQKALSYFRAHTDAKTGLVAFDRRFWLFLDWSDLVKESGFSTIYNLWLLIALDKLAVLYRKAHKGSEASPLEAWAKKLRVALGRLVNKEGLMPDALDWSGKVLPEASIHSQTLSLMAGLKGVTPKAALEKVLLPFIRGVNQPKAMPSAYWITYVFSVLIQHGHGREVVEFIRKTWIPMANHGTTWENFNPAPGNESFSHAWSAHPLYHLMATTGGITQTGPAWSEILFRPVFHGSRCRTVVPSPRGPIVSEWKREGKTMAVELKLPRGVKARVELPGLRPQNVTGNRKWAKVNPA